MTIADTLIIAGLSQGQDWRKKPQEHNLLLEWLLRKDCQQNQALLERGNNFGHLHSIVQGEIEIDNVIIFFIYLNFNVLMV